MGGGIVPPANVERTAGRRGGADREETLPPHSQAVSDAHLMIVDPAPSIRRSVAAGADRIAIHLRGKRRCSQAHQDDPRRRAEGGVATSPETPVGALGALAPMVDQAPAVCIDPRFGGQRFIDRSIEKLRSPARGLGVLIGVDGGNPANAVQLARAGADVLAAGSCSRDRGEWRSAADERLIPRSFRLRMSECASMLAATTGRG